MRIVPVRSQILPMFDQIGFAKFVTRTMTFVRIVGISR